METLSQYPWSVAFFHFLFSHFFFLFAPCRSFSVFFASSSPRPSETSGHTRAIESLDSSKTSVSELSRKKSVDRHRNPTSHDVAALVFPNRYRV